MTVGASFESDTFDGLLRSAYEAVLGQGERLVPSRGGCRELRGVQLVLTDPRARLSRSWRRGRALSAVAEFVWYASGSSRVEAITPYIPSYAGLVGTDGLAAGAYGPRLFGPTGQLETIVTALAASPTTRQAVAQLFDRDDLGGNHRDVPCTCTLQFFIRGDRLELHVHMRSNDAVLGLPHDVFSFTMIHEWVAVRLGVGLGPYVHTVGSFHIYDEHASMAEDYLAEGFYEPRGMDAMPAEDPKAALQALVLLEPQIRAGSAAADQLPPGYWGDLARLLWLQVPGLAPVTGSHNLPSELRMSSSFFDVYLQDRTLRTAGRSGDAGRV